jgi:hypothetical protein
MLEGKLRNRGKLTPDKAKGQKIRADRMVAVRRSQLPSDTSLPESCQAATTTLKTTRCSYYPDMTVAKSIYHSDKKCPQYNIYNCTV